MKDIDSKEKMISRIREFGLLPLFKGAIPGWSIEEMTPAEHWFYTSDDLGPWDWKVDAVDEGDLAYGKFIGGKAAFATLDLYAHLMNWRRSQAKYRMPVGERCSPRNNSEKLMKYLSPLILDEISRSGAMEAREIRAACSGQITPYQLKMLGARNRASVSPSIKKSVMDQVLQYLESGTWIVTGNIERIYRGPSLEYSGWQRGTYTRPEDIFGGSGSNDDAPSWARMFEEETGSPLETGCSPEESRMVLVNHVRSIFPDADEDVLMKLI